MHTRHVHKTGITEVKLYKSLYRSEASNGVLPISSLTNVALMFASKQAWIDPVVLWHRGSRQGYGGESIIPSWSVLYADTVPCIRMHSYMVCAETLHWYRGILSKWDRDCDRSLVPLWTAVTVHVGNTRPYFHIFVFESMVRKNFVLHPHMMLYVYKLHLQYFKNQCTEEGVGS